MSKATRRKSYAGEGRIIVAGERSPIFRPLALLSLIWDKIQGRKPKITMTLTRDFYAKITSEPSFVILGEERYGMSRRIASVKRPKPKPAKNQDH